MLRSAVTSRWAPTRLCLCVWVIGRWGEGVNFGRQWPLAFIRVASELLRQGAAPGGRRSAFGCLLQILTFGPPSNQGAGWQETHRRGAPPRLHVRRIDAHGAPCGRK